MTIKATIYRQTFDHELLKAFEVTKDDLELGYALFPCSECDGTGIFEGPDFHAICVACRGRGKLWCNV